MSSAELNLTRNKINIRSMFLKSLKYKESLLCVAFFFLMAFVLFQTKSWSERGEYQDSYPWVEDFSEFEETRYNRNYEEISILSPTKKIRICSQEERIRHMMKVCTLKPNARTSALMAVSKRSIYDEKHKVLMCWMSKAGCTAFKALLLEAAGYQIAKANITHNLMPVHAKDLLKEHGLVNLNLVSDDQIKTILEESFVFMLIRHPFERLLSTYRGKVVDASSDFPWFAANALKLAHPNLFKDNKTLSDMKKPQTVLGPPTFGQFLEWIRESGNKNDHWSMIVDACHPCAHNWSAILRLETMEHDSSVLLEHLQPDLNISRIPVRHSHQNEPVHDHDWLRMPEYDDIKDEVIDYFLQMYDTDMEMFGYRWDKTSNIASCSIETANGPCC